MKKKTALLVKGALVVTAAGMTANLFGYIYHLVIGRVLGPERYGELATYLSLIFLFGIPSSTLATVVTRQIATLLSQGKQGRISAFIQRFAIILGGIVIGIGLIYVILIPFLRTFLGLSNIRGLVAVYGIFASSFFLILPMSALQGTKRFTDFSIVSVIAAGLRLVFGVAVARLGVTMILISNICSNLLSLLVSLLPLGALRQIPKQPVFVPLITLLSFSVPTLLATIAMTSLYTIDTILVKHFFSAYDAGIYASLATLGKVILFASLSIAPVLFPTITMLAQQSISYRSILLNGFFVVFSISVSIVLLYGMFSSFVMLALFGNKFVSAAPYLGWVGVFMSGIAMMNYLLMVLLAAGRAGIWKIVAILALLQVNGIVLFHSTLWEVVRINVLVSILGTGGTLWYALRKDKFA